MKRKAPQKQKKLFAALFATALCGYLPLPLPSRDGKMPPSLVPARPA